MSAVIDEMAELVRHAEDSLCGAVYSHSETNQTTNGGICNVLKLAVVGGGSARPLTLEAITKRSATRERLVKSTTIQCRINDQKVVPRVIAAAANPDLQLDEELAIFLRLLFRGRINFALERTEEIHSAQPIKTRVVAHLIRGPYGVFFQERFDDCQGLGDRGIQIASYYGSTHIEAEPLSDSILKRQDALAAVILIEVIGEFRRLLLDKI